MQTQINELFINDADAKYIQNCWKQFTTLTDQEEKNLKEIIGIFKVKKKKNIHQGRNKVIKCTETGKIYNNVHEIAKEFNINSPQNIYTYIKHGWRLHGHFTLKYVYRTPTETENKIRKKILWITLR